MDSREKLRVIEFGIHDAYQNMALDQYLLRLCEQGHGHGFLRCYGWQQPALSLGHSEPVNVIDLDRARDDGVQVVRRPTGGRVVLHGDDLTYAIVLPKREAYSLAETYRAISMCIIKGLKAMGLSLSLERGLAHSSGRAGRPCFGSVSRYEVTCGGRKVVGSAQRVGERAVLQQGSIPIGRGYLGVADYIGGSAAGRARLRSAIAASTCCLADIMVVRPDAPSIGRLLVEGFRADFLLDDDPIDQRSFDGDVRSLAQALRDADLTPEA
jgi:hypothetical protein